MKNIIACEVYDMTYEIGIQYTDTQVTDQQVKIDLSNVNINVNKLQFYYQNNKIPHWVEDYTNKIVWVKLPVLQNGITKIYVDDFTNKDLSNIDKTMIFGDDFRNETALDTNKWTVVNNTGTTITFGSGFLDIKATGGSNNGSIIISTWNTNNITKYLMKTCNWISTPGTVETTYILGGAGLGNSTDTSINNTFLVNGYNSDISEYGIYVYSSSVPKTYQTIFNNQTSGYHVYTLHLTSQQTADGWKDDEKQSITATGLPTNITYTAKIGAQSNAYIEYKYYNVFIYKYLPTDPQISYIKPKTKLFYIKNTIFTQSSDILSYNTNSYIETPVIELTSIQHSQINSSISKPFYYRGSNIQPDITQSGNIIDIDNITHNYWDQNIISNSGWNNTTPSSYITYTSDTIIDYKYIQYKIPLEYVE